MPNDGEASFASSRASGRKNSTGIASASATSTTSSSDKLPQQRIDQRADGGGVFVRQRLSGRQHAKLSCGALDQVGAGFGDVGHGISQGASGAKAERTSFSPHPEEPRRSPKGEGGACLEGCGPVSGHMVRDASNHKSAIADLCIQLCRARVNPRSMRRSSP